MFHNLHILRYLLNQQWMDACLPIRISGHTAQRYTFVARPSLVIAASTMHTYRLT